MLQIVIEADEALTNALLARGAELTLHTVFMNGELGPGGQDIGRPS